MRAWSADMRARMAGIGFVLAAALACPQPAASQSFDVASIKPSRAARAGGEGSGRERITVSPNSVLIENAGVNFCIQWAYGVKFYQVSGAGWLISERYDISAKTERRSSKEQLMTMMRALLADRFQLQLHRETRMVPVYQLVARSKTPKIKPANSDATATGMTVENGSFVFHRVTMAEFAEKLSDFATIERPVLDRTGMEGQFDIILTSAAAAMRSDPDAIVAAVEANGLRLDSARAPLETLVVDHAERPSPN